LAVELEVVVRMLQEEPILETADDVFVGDASGESREAVDVVVVAPAGTIPSPCFNNTPRVTAFVDLLPEVDRGSVMKVDLKWILALMP
jgi:hypothetical protein